MIQDFPELQRINKGLAVDIGFVMLMQVTAGKHKTCDLPIAEADVCKVAAHADKKRTPEDVCGLKTGMQ
ncbi:MAG: hypothetical protein GY710_14130 [Desulfobacteraceae bacterium]|nr:hypothetical protein [Desulfobacteraceae bacterium]